MAWIDFYIQSGGDDLCGGSGTGSPTASDTGGNGTVLQGGGAGGTTDRYTANAGTPFSGTSVGDYVGIYTGTPTATSYVAKVTAVNGGGASVDYDNTNTGLGTRPTNGATYKAKTGGAHASLNPWNNFGSVATHGSTRVNIKAATYTLVSSIPVLAVNGGTTRPIWYRGYNTTPGDLDNGSATLAYPTFSGDSGSVVEFTGSYLLGTALIVNTAFNGEAVYFGGSPQSYWHCQFINSGTGASANAVQMANSLTLNFVNCYFSSPAAGPAIIQMATCNITMLGCYFKGANSGTTQSGIALGGGFLGLIGCTISQTGTHGVNITSGGPLVNVTGCTFAGCLGDSIRITPNTATGMIVNNVFANSGGYDINNNSGGNIAGFFPANNLSYSPTSGHLNGFGDVPEFNALTDTSSPFVSSTDLHLVSTSNGAGSGAPGRWEGL